MSGTRGAIPLPPKEPIPRGNRRDSVMLRQREPHQLHPFPPRLLSSRAPAQHTGSSSGELGQPNTTRCGGNVGSPRGSPVSGMAREDAGPTLTQDHILRYGNAGV